MLGHGTGPQLCGRSLSIPLLRLGSHYLDARGRGRRHTAEIAESPDRKGLSSRGWVNRDGVDTLLEAPGSHSEARLAL
jgi:hypothetical protein